jgi:hypothetical protein
MNVLLDNQDLRPVDLYSTLVGSSSRNNNIDGVRCLLFFLLSLVCKLTCLPPTRTYRDALSQNPQLKKTNYPVGLMLKRQQKKSTKIPKCQAYAWNTDFPQRPGALFHGALYHSLTRELPPFRIKLSP